MSRRKSTGEEMVELVSATINKLDLNTMAAPAMLNQAASRKPRRRQGGQEYNIHADDIDRDTNQPRKDFTEDSILRLANTMLKYGQLQPISVYQNPAASDRYILHIGERRWRAGKLLVAENPDFRLRCIILTDKPQKAKTVQVIENLHREGLNVIDFGEACLDLVNNGMTQAEVADEYCCSPAYVSMALSICKNTSKELHVAVKSGKVTIEEAYEASRVDAEKRDEIEAGIIDGTKTANDARDAANNKRRSNRGRPRANTPKTDTPKTRTPKPPFSETLDLGKCYVTVTYKRATKSPGNAALATELQAGAKIYLEREDSAD
jgi:ParB/RepB/Spo0J family partition protein